MLTPRLRLIIIGAAILVVAGVGAVIALPAIKSFVGGNKAAAASPARNAEPVPAELIVDNGGNYGLRLSKDVVRGFEISPHKVLKAEKPRALPPLPGTINYDNERLFTIKSRFPGEVADVHRIRDTEDTPLKPSEFRFIRFGDKIPQGELLAIVWSKDLGEKKAALVDAMCAYRLSKYLLDNQAKLYKEGAISEAIYRNTERLAQGDRNAMVTAERTLRMWKLTDEEIKEVKDEAYKIFKILDAKKERSAKDEKNWARVDMKTPLFSEIPDPAHPGKTIPNPKQMLTIVEKNVHISDMVDPTVVMFKLADLSKLQIWVNVHEEFLARMRRGQKDQDVSKLKWKIEIEGSPEPMWLSISQVAPSLDPMAHTLSVIGYLNNPDLKFRIGQFVTATIYVEPEADTVEIPTDALNEVEGEALVFVQKDGAKRDYMLRRISVVNRFKDVTFVRSKLSKQDEESNKQVSKEDIKQGKRRIQPLQPGERVLTRGVVELTAALKKALLEKQEN